MDAQLAKEFRDRWQAVTDIEMQEQRSSSLDLRWQQLNAILQLAIGLGISLSKLDRQEEIVRQRWAKLKGISV